MTRAPGISNRKRLTEKEKKERARNYKLSSMRRAVMWHLTQCVCPKCGKHHVMNTLNVGSEPCRMYCVKCRYAAENTYIPDSVSVGYRSSNACGDSPRVVEVE